MQPCTARPTLQVAGNTGSQYVLGVRKLHQAQSDDFVKSTPPDETGQYHPKEQASVVIATFRRTGGVVTVTRAIELLGESDLLSVHRELLVLGSE